MFGHAFQFLPSDGTHLVSTGMHHAGGQSFYLGALNVGQPLAIMARFDAGQTLGMIEKHSVTTAYTVPTQFVRFVKLPAGGAVPLRRVQPEIWSCTPRRRVRLKSKKCAS